jgi:hypothetical protein
MLNFSTFNINISTWIKHFRYPEAGDFVQEEEEHLSRGGGVCQRRCRLVEGRGKSTRGGGGKAWGSESEKRASHGRGRHLLVGHK